MKKFKSERTPRVKDRLAEMEVRPSKSRGQNFLIDPQFTQSIVDFGQVHPGENVVEIGPGLGAMTKILSSQENLTLVEIEPKFCQALAKEYPHVKIVNSDVREVDFAGFGDHQVIFGNLPYSFSTDIIFHLIAFAPHIDRAILLLQKEFAARLAAPPGGKDYSVLSISCQISADVRLGPIVGGNSFHPPTAVDSQVVELRFPKTPKFQIDDIFWLKRVVSASFIMRRKMIKNCLKASKIVDGDKVDLALAAAGIDHKRRAETLDIPEFITLATELGRYRGASSF